MRFLDLFGDGRYRLNLGLVRLLKVEDRGEKVGLHFVYADDHESIFAVPSARFRVFAQIFQEQEVAA